MTMIFAAHTSRLYGGGVGARHLRPLKFNDPLVRAAAAGTIKAGARHRLAPAGFRAAYCEFAPASAAVPTCAYARAAAPPAPRGGGVALYEVSQVDDAAVTSRPALPLPRARRRLSLLQKR